LNKKTRPSWDEYFIEGTKFVATRATCPRMRVGAIIVRDRRILTTGYNGAPPGLPHCDDVGCLIIKGHCVRSNHAEKNAILQAASTGIKLKGADMYSLCLPCLGCMKDIISVGIKKVIYKKEQGKHNKEYQIARQWAKQAGVEVVRLKGKQK